MSAFTGSLSITEIDVDLEIWELNQPLVYEVGHLGSGRFITVPAGFRSDGASIPGLVSWFLPRWGRYRRAAIIHDYLCIRLRQGRPHEFAPTRKVADQIFLETLKVSGVNWPVRSVLYTGVRLGTKFPILSDWFSYI